MPKSNTNFESYTFIVDANKKGSRLDTYISGLLKEVSRSQIQRWIDENFILVNNKKTTSSYKLKDNDNIFIQKPPLKPATPVAQDISLDILYEDNNIIVINKGSGMVVHPAAGNWDNTLVNALLKHCEGSLSGIGGVERPGIVHRIDKDTSGVLVIAKNDQSHINLSAKFSTHDIQRVYYAVVWSIPTKSSGTIINNIGRDSKNRKKMAILNHGGKHSVTHYQVLQSWSIDDVVIASLVKCTLETGRTHQIRVHMSSIGCPLIGDEVYKKNNSKIVNKLKKSPYSDEILNFERQALHAKVLGFAHPITGENLIFETEIPSDIQKLLNDLTNTLE